MLVFVQVKNCADTCSTFFSNFPLLAGRGNNPNEDRTTTREGSFALMFGWTAGNKSGLMCGSSTR